MKSQTKKNKHMIHADGAESWWKNGKRHRVDGPAVIHPDGFRAWYIHGNLHRVDGPAMIWPNGSNAWYVENERIRSYKDFQRLTGWGDEALIVFKLKRGMPFSQL